MSLSFKIASRFPQMFSLYFYSSAIFPDSLFGFGSEGLNHSFIVLPEEHCWLMFQAMFPQWQAVL
jgi:hypothetical protein